MSYVKVSSEKTLRLVPQIPFVISWLRHSDPFAADLFLGSAKHVDEDEVQQVYKNLLEALDTYGDLTTAQLRGLCQDHEPAVWARAIHTLFMGSEPRIVPRKVSQGLFDAFKKVRDLSNGTDIATKLGSEIDKLRLVSIEALGELCALIRDTSQDPRFIAMQIGPTIFLDETCAQGDLVVASHLMQALVEHAELVFGKVSCRSMVDALGVRPSGYDQQSMFDSESTISGRSNNRRPKEKKEMASALSEAGFL